MERHWGDLRTLIDHQMIRLHNQGPPFSPDQVLNRMQEIAKDMARLHMQHMPILHQDLKAANVLVWKSQGTDEPYLNEHGRYGVSVADFECSVGVVGTGFWRAPEILQQLKNKVPLSKLTITEKCDVYSYGMTCYELVSGHIPFEDYQDRSKDGFYLVLKGERLELPPSLDPLLKQIITACWHPIPSKRPSFKDIKTKLGK